ncbi:LytTR family DNA-binding domain-containing protein [Ancylobacter sonchi]
MALGLSPVFAWVRPFGVDEQTFFARLGYWSGLLVCWFMLMAALEMLVANRPFFRNLSPSARRMAIIGIAAFPMIIVAGIATNALSGWQASVYQVVELYWQIALVGSIVTLVAKAVLPWRTEPAMPEAPPQELVPSVPEAMSPLVARLPLDVRGRILCLEMEDHYVRVHTDRGAALVLMRLSDAMNEAHPVKGRQVHRSWWVSDEAVEEFERVGRTGMLHLRNGSRAPVSQRYLRSVEASFS